MESREYYQNRYNHLESICQDIEMDIAKKTKAKKNLMEELRDIQEILDIIDSDAKNLSGAELLDFHDENKNKFGNMLKEIEKRQTILNAVTEGIFMLEED